MTADGKGIQKVLVVGAGVMGRQISLQCALHGFSAALNDVSAEILDDAMTGIEQYARELVARRRVTKDDASAALNRIVPRTSAEEAAEDAVLLIESVPEELEVKQQVLARFNRLCPSGTVFATNTSSFLPSLLTAATGRPSSFASLHFNPYIWDTGIVEIMPHCGTSERTMAFLEGFAGRIGLSPVVLKSESPGYISNALINAVNNASLSLVSSGVTTAQDVDRIWMSLTRTRIGPFGSLDFIGLDIAYQVTHYWAAVIGSPSIQANARFLKQFVDQGRLGVKTGQGFYTYPDPEFAREGFLRNA